jgi:hypothetical protein
MVNPRAGSAAMRYTTLVNQNYFQASASGAYGRKTAGQPAAKHQDIGTYLCFLTIPYRVRPQ